MFEIKGTTKLNWVSLNEVTKQGWWISDCGEFVIRVTRDGFNGKRVWFYKDQAWSIAYDAEAGDTKFRRLGPNESITFTQGN